MIDGIPALLGVAPTFGTALVLIYLVFTGRLVVKAQHEQQLTLLNTQIGNLALERDTWRAASESKDATIKTLADSNASLMETAEFSTKVMSALQLNSGGVPNA